MIDASAIMVLLVILFMPPQNVNPIGAYEHRNKGDKARDVDAVLAKASVLQSKLLARPDDGNLAEEYAALMSDIGRHDMALRIAGHSAALESPLQWRSLGAVSAAFADRIEIRSSLEWAQKAMVACEKIGANDCPAHEKLRMRLYIDQLHLGVAALDKGANPKFDPDGFRREISKTHLTTRTGKNNKE